MANRIRIYTPIKEKESETVPFGYMIDEANKRRAKYPLCAEAITRIEGIFLDRAARGEFHDHHDTRIELIAEMDRVCAPRVARGFGNRKKATISKALIIPIVGRAAPLKSKKRKSGVRKLRLYKSQFSKS